MARRRYETFTINEGKKRKPRMLTPGTPEYRAAHNRRRADNYHFEKRILEENKEVWE